MASQGHLQATFAAISVIILALSVDCSQPSEFLHSFLSRERLLPNASSEPILKRPDALTVSVFVDNWSEYRLLHTAHAVAAGVMEAPLSLSPADLREKRRSFAMRTAALEKKGGRKTEETAGMVGWTMERASDGVKVGRLSVAWRVNGSGGKEVSIFLGDKVPQFDGIWTEGQSSGELDCVVQVADSRSTAAAKLTLPRSSSSLHYQLRVTIVPQKLDVFAWVKYFGEVEEKTTTTVKRGQEMQQQQQQALRKGAGASSSSGEDEESKSQPLFHRKDLLRPGPALQRVEERGLGSLREALRVDTSEGSAVAVGIHIENWTRHRLGTPQLEIKSGRVMTSATTSTTTTQDYSPGPVDPGVHDVMVVVAEGALSGTSGVARWSIGEENDVDENKEGIKVLSVMWSLPYNLQFYSTWTAVGVTDQTSLPPTYDEMYSGEDGGTSRFARAKAGRDLEFSDGEFVVMAFMDGGSSSKPVLRLGLLPRAEEDLASPIRKQLGMPVLPQQRGNGSSKESRRARLKELQALQNSGGSSSSMRVMDVREVASEAANTGGGEVKRFVICFLNLFVMLLL